MFPRTPAAAAFRSLERVLVRRRLLGVDLRLRLELLALAGLLGGFLFWQARIPLDGLLRMRGEGAVAAAVLATLLAMAALGGLIAGSRHAVRLRRGPPGPPWLALPLPPELLGRHLAFDSSAPALALVVPAAGVLLGAAGLAPAWWLAGCALAFAVSLAAAVGLGCAIAFRTAAAAVPSRPALHPLTRVLATAARRARSARLPAPRWRGGPVWLTLWRKDLLLSWRPTPARQRALPPIVLAPLAALVWWLPLEIPVARLLAFALALLAAATFAEWLIALAGCDPFAVLRTLPVGVGAVWGARMATAAAGVALLLAGQAAGARALDPQPHALFLVWTGAATLAIATLGANYGVTTYPHHDQAQRLLGLSLGVAMAASIMIPLLGWVLLLTAVLHSLRRLPRWTALEAS